MIHISVTQEDIDNGAPGDSCRCPVALACLRAGLVEEDFYEAINWLAEELPESVRTFIPQFDNGETVMPFEFDWND